ncbi:MAG: hypothetical protein RIT81_05485 [Deltaproteobacteria bacterium]
MTEPKNDLWYERVALGELTPDDLTAEERERVDAIVASNAAILEHLPPAGVRREVERRMVTAKKKRWPIFLVPAFAAAAALALVFVGESPTERTKGNARLVVHAKTTTGIEQVRAGDALERGALLQVGYTPGGSGYGAVVSIDGRGVVTLHWPASPSAWSPTVEPEGGTLPSAYELDDAPRFERFFLVTCAERFLARDAIDTAESLEDPETGALAVKDGCRTHSLAFKKKEPTR